MPLFDFFKKSNKNKTSKSETDKDVFDSPTKKENRINAATEAWEMFYKYFQAPQPHPGTILATAGRLTGTSLYRSIGEEHDGKPGTMIKSEKADQEWQKLLNLFMTTLGSSASALDPNHFLLLDTPNIHKPKENILQVQEALQEEYNTIMKRHGLDYEEGARAGVIACARLYNDYCVKRKDLDPNLGASIIVKGFIAGSRMIPVPLKAESSRTSIYGQSIENDAGKQFTSDNPFSSPEQQKKRYEAAMEFIELFLEKTPLLHDKPHAGTVMSAAARLAGTSLFRAINKKDVTPGTIVLSDEVNTAYPQLLNQFAYYSKENGIDVMAKPLLTEFPENDKPLMELAQIQSVYQDEYHAIMKKHGLDYLEGARAGIIVCSAFFNELCINNKAIDPYVATGIVAIGVVEGAKTSPIPLGGKAASDNNSKEHQAVGLIKTIAESSVSGAGTRLVLGETFTAGKEAQKNGGKYILVHPEVQKQLKTANFDLFLIYETALLFELQNKIEQVDLVGVNVDELLQEWSGKPDDQAPMHVRQMLWLKENAEKYGYQRSGNSWKLKS